MSLPWDWSSSRFTRAGVPVLPVIIGATRVVDWVTRCVPDVQVPEERILGYRRTRERLAAMAPVILGHMSEAGLADPSRGIYAAGEPDMWELHQNRGWERPLRRDVVEAAAHNAIEGSGAAKTPCWLFTECAWDLLAGAGHPERPRVSPEEAAERILELIGVIREVDPIANGRPIIWAESSGELGKTEGWTRARVLETFRLVGDAVQVHAANRYTSRFPVGAGYRPWFWKDLPGPKGLVECGWLPYEQDALTADPQRLARAGWELPKSNNMGYPHCDDQVERLARWVDLAGEISSDKDSCVVGYYGGTSHGDGKGLAARPWGLVSHPWGRRHADRWHPVAPLREAAAAIRARWTP